MKSSVGQARQVIFGVNAAVVSVGEGDIQAITQIADADDGDARKRLRKAAIEARARTMRALAGETELLRRQDDAASFRCGHRKRRQVGTELAVVHCQRCCCGHRHDENRPSPQR